MLAACRRPSVPSNAPEAHDAFGELRQETEARWRRYAPVPVAPAAWMPGCYEIHFLREPEKGTLRVIPRQIKLTDHPIQSGRLFAVCAKTPAWVGNWSPVTQHEFELNFAIHSITRIRVSEDLKAHVHIQDPSPNEGPALPLSLTRVECPAIGSYPECSDGVPE